MKTRSLAVPLLLLLGSTACIEPTTVDRRTSLMGYLYPRGKAAPVPDPRGARLQLPLKLGIAFVPSAQDWNNQRPVAPQQEAQLLGVVKEAFAARPWVGGIKTIPSAYLAAGGGFDNLDQLAAMFGVDVVALVSVDQIQHTDPRWYSITYLTIVGAYVVPGDVNSTSTLMDVAVFDVRSRSFLLRAPGQSVVKGRSTAMSQAEDRRQDAAQGFQLATADLARNLDREIGAFKDQIAKGERQDVDILDKKGQSLRQTQGRNWGGAFGMKELALATLLLLGLGWTRRR